MINFPAHFIPLKNFPGYFWNDEEKHLYSLKVTGVLRPLSLTAATVFNGWNEDGFRISVKGVRRTIFPSRIERYLARKDYVWPVASEDKHVR